MSAHDDGGLPASIETAWDVGSGSGRGRPARLSLDQIVDAAVGLAVAQGLGAVSMARVAAEIGASTMSLYRHVATKAELLALMVDAALGPPPETTNASWRPALSDWAWAQHARLRVHPWAARVPIEGPPTTPNVVAWVEAALAALRDTGLAEHEKASAVLLVSGYLRGEAAITMELESSTLAAADPNEAMSAYANLLRRLLDPERFPALHTLLAAGVFDRADHPDVEFSFGLERILDGIGALVERRRS